MPENQLPEKPKRGRPRLPQGQQKRGNSYRVKGDKFDGCEVLGFRRKKKDGKRVLFYELSCGCGCERIFEIDGRSITNLKRSGKPLSCAAADAVIPRPKAGSVVNGQTVLSVVSKRTPGGKMLDYLTFCCEMSECSVQFEMTISAVTRAIINKSKMQCQRCREAAYRIGARKAESDELTLSASGKISVNTLKAIDRLRLPERKKVDAMVRRHFRACLENNIRPDSLDRVYIEAMEVVKLEGQLPVTEYTRANISEGLQRQSYDHYL